MAIEIIGNRKFKNQKNPISILWNAPSSLLLYMTLCWIQEFFLGNTDIDNDIDKDNDNNVNIDMCITATNV